MSEVIADAEHPCLCDASECFGDVADFTVVPCGKASGHVVRADIVVVENFECGSHLESEIDAGRFLGEQRFVGCAVDNETFVFQFGVGEDGTPLRDSKKNPGWIDR